MCSGEKKLHEIYPVEKIWIKDRHWHFMGNDEEALHFSYCVKTLTVKLHYRSFRGELTFLTNVIFPKILDICGRFEAVWGESARVRKCVNFTVLVCLSNAFSRKKLKTPLCVREYFLDSLLLHTCLWYVSIFNHNFVICLQGFARSNPRHCFCAESEKQRRK